MLAYFTSAIIEMDPFNTSSKTGQWALFSCSILCSHRDLITWYVNGSTLSSAEGHGFTFQTDPSHSYCSVTDSNMLNYTLSLKVDYPIDRKINIHCAVVSLCDSESAPNCSITTCHSGDAYLDGICYNKSIMNSKSSRRERVS